jgi:hypothetical protein
MRLDKRETDRGLHAIACIIASVILGALVLAFHFLMGDIPNDRRK